MSTYKHAAPVEPAPVDDALTAKQTANRNTVRSNSPLSSRRQDKTEDEPIAMLVEESEGNVDQQRVNALYPDTYRILKKYRPGQFQMYQVWQEYKDDVITVVIDLYGQDNPSA